MTIPRHDLGKWALGILGGAVIALAGALAMGQDIDDRVAATPTGQRVIYLETKVRSMAESLQRIEQGVAEISARLAAVEAKLDR